MTETKPTEPFLVRLQEAIDADPTINVSNLAVKAGLGNSAIRLMLKNNNSPRIDTARKICAALGVTLEEFMSNAQTEEELEIVRLVMQLDAASRRELLGYGRGLAAAQDPAPPTDPEDTQ